MEILNIQDKKKVAKPGCSFGLGLQIEDYILYIVSDHSYTLLDPCFKMELSRGIDWSIKK